MSQSITKSLRKSHKKIDDLLNNIQSQSPSSQQLELSRRQFVQAIQAYLFIIGETQSNLFQIFLHYCSQSLHNGQAIEIYQKVSQFLDYRFYLKYFKDFHFAELDHKKQTMEELENLFIKKSSHGKHLTFQEFWSIHKLHLGLNDEIISKTKIEASDIGYMTKMKEKIEGQRAKFEKLNYLLINSSVYSQIIAGNAKTRLSPLKKLTKSQSTKLPTISSVRRQPSYSQSQKPMVRRKSFIQQIRREVSNQKNLESDLLIKRSVSTIQPSSKGLLETRLPKLLKIPSQKLQSQGIYQSLKRFANYDYISQQQKIKNIIGISKGDDQEYMKAYFNKQMQVKEEIIANQNKEREERKKQALENSGKKQAVCNKNHIQQMEPYMRF